MDSNEGGSGRSDSTAGLNMSAVSTISLIKEQAGTGGVLSDGHGVTTIPTMGKSSTRSARRAMATTISIREKDIPGLVG